MSVSISGSQWDGAVQLDRFAWQHFTIYYYYLLDFFFFNYLLLQIICEYHQRLFIFFIRHRRLCVASRLVCMWKIENNQLQHKPVIKVKLYVLSVIVWAAFSKWNENKSAIMLHHIDEKIRNNNNGTIWARRNNNK